MEYPEGTEFDSSDTSVYFVKCGQVQLKAADKQLEDREVRQTVAQAAVAAQTMAATGPLSKVLYPPPPPPPPPLDMVLSQRKLSDHAFCCRADHSGIAAWHCTSACVWLFDRHGLSCFKCMLKVTAILSTSLNFTCALIASQIPVLA